MDAVYPDRKKGHTHPAWLWAFLEVLATEVTHGEAVPA